MLQRGNFFLVAESLLVVAYASLLGVSNVSGRANVAAVVIALFGLLLTVAWIYVGYRHWLNVKYLRRLVESRSLDMKAIWAQRPRNPISTTLVMTLHVPLLAGLTWLMLVVIVV